MNTLQQQFVTLVSTPFYVIIIGIEILLSSIQHTQSYHWKDSARNFALSILGGLTDLLMRAVSLAVMSFCFANALLHLSQTWIYWALLVLAVDFLPLLAASLKPYQPLLLGRACESSFKLPFQFHHRIQSCRV